MRNQFKVFLVVCGVLVTAVLSGCSKHTVYYVEEGKYYIDDDTYIQVTEMDSKAENSQEDGGFLGTCKIQFFNYDFSLAEEIYETDMSKQFAEEACLCNYGTNNDRFYIYVDVEGENEAGMALNFPVEYVPQDHSLVLVTDEKFIKK